MDPLKREAGAAAEGRPAAECWPPDKPEAKVDVLMLLRSVLGGRGAAGAGARGGGCGGA